MRERFQGRRSGSAAFPGGAPRIPPPYSLHPFILHRGNSFGIFLSICSI